MTKIIFGVEHKSEEYEEDEQINKDVSTMPKIELNSAVIEIVDLIKSKKCKKILAYGYVQSGKTANMISVAYELLREDLVDIIIVLTGTITELNEQNFKRFENKLKDYVKITNFTNSNPMDSANKKIIVTMKNTKRLKQLTNYVESLKNPSRVLIIDDESDHATLDNNNSKKLKSSKATNPSATHKEVLKLFKSCNSTLLAYTATPQGMLLGGEENELRPDKIILLEPFEGYFGVKNIIEDDQYLHIIEDTPKEYHSNGELTEDLKKAIKYFFDKLVELKNNDDLFYNMVINNTAITLGHKNLKKEIETFLAENNYNEISVIEINGRDKNKNLELELEEKKSKIIIGGVKLSRGLTIDNLLVFFTSNVSQENKHDTVYQRMRFCGNRKSYKEYIRLYATSDMYEFYHEIHSNTELIRNAVRSGSNTIENKIWYISNSISKNSNLIPTRKGVMSGAIDEKVTGGSNNILIDKFKNEENFNKCSKKLNDFFSKKEKISIDSDLNYNLYKTTTEELSKTLRNIIYTNNESQQLIDNYIKIYNFYISSRDSDNDSIFIATNFHKEGNPMVRSENSNSNITFFGDSERSILNSVIEYTRKEPNLLVYITNSIIKRKEKEEKNLIINFCFTGGIEVKYYELP